MNKEQAKQAEKEVEQQKIRTREETIREYYEKRERELEEERRKFEAHHTRMKLQSLAILGHLVQDMAATREKTTKHLFCMKCLATGSTRLDAVLEHSLLLDEQKSFAFLIDNDERRLFIQQLENRIGVVIDTFEIELDGEVKKVYLCVPCQRQLNLIV